MGVTLTWTKLQPWALVVIRWNAQSTIIALTTLITLTKLTTIRINEPYVNDDDV